MEKLKIKVTNEYKTCLKLIKNDEKFIFISGKAGSGKSILIKFIKSKIRNKKIILVAPTGISAINIGGQTIHSMFGFTSDNITTAKNINYEATKNGVFDIVNLIIIDEISMVRADIMDGIDIALRRIRRNNEPFGGVQIIAVGDLFQLQPIVKTFEEKQHFNGYYNTEFFFSAKVFEKIDFSAIILNEVFRQSDTKTIEALNTIRNNPDNREAIGYINRHCYGVNKEFSTIPRDITLTTDNYNAGVINKNELLKLNTKQFNYNAVIKGYFKTKIITPELLTLKVGASVMFTKNGNEWANGTLAEIIELSHDNIEVKLKHNNKIVSVSRELWENKKYQVSPDGTEIDAVVIGSFKQFPLVLAWAITIHKSQGLTLDNMRVDLHKGAFAAGQVYVALSRCKDLNNVTLARPIRISEVKRDQRIIDFYSRIEEKEFKKKSKE